MTNRSLPSGVETNWQGTAPTYVRLYQLEVLGGSTIRWWLDLSACTFNSQTFSPRRGGSDRQTFANQTKSGSLDVQVSDVDGAFAAVIASGLDLQGSTLTIYRTTRASLGGAGSDAHFDVYVVDTYTRKGIDIVLSVKSRLSLFGVKVPREILTKARFPGMPSESA